MSLSARQINLEVLNFSGFIAAMCFSLVLKTAPEELITLFFLEVQERERIPFILSSTTSLQGVESNMS